MEKREVKVQVNHLTKRFGDLSLMVTTVSYFAPTVILMWVFLPPKDWNN